MTIVVPAIWDIIHQYHSTTSYMQKQIFSTAFLFLLLSVLLHAQPAPVWSVQNEEIKKPVIFGGFVCHDDQGTVTWHINEKKWSIVRSVGTITVYDTNLKVIAQAVPPEEYNGADVQFLNVFKLGANIYGLFLGNSGNKLSLMAWQIDRATALTMGQPIVLWDVKPKFSKKELNRYLQWCQCAFNDDKSEMAIVFPENDDNGNKQICYFDSSLKLIWQKKIESERLLFSSPYDSHRIIIKDGNLAMMYSAILNDEEEKITGNKGIAYKSFHALLIANKGATVKDVMMNPGAGMFPISLEILPQSDGSWRCLGAYTKRNKSLEFLPNDSRMRPFIGSYDIRLSSEGSIIGAPVTNDFVTTLLQDRKAIEKESKVEYNRSELWAFKPVNTVPLPNGEAALIFESFHFSTSPRSPYVTTWKMADLVILRLTQKGEFRWVKVMPKDQSTKVVTDLNYGGFGLITEGETMHFIYLDDFGSAVDCHWDSIDATGKMTKNKSWLAGKNSHGIMPRMGIQVGEKQFIVPAAKDEIFQVGLIKL